MRAALILLIGGCGGEDETPTRTPDPTETVSQTVDVTDTATTTTSPTGPTSFDLTGTVIDADGAPVPDAMVMFGGRPDTLIWTDESGEFSIRFTPLGYGEPTLVAAKEGYRSVGEEFFDAGDVIVLTLRHLSEVDNLDYVYQDPGDGGTGPGDPP